MTLITRLFPSFENAGLTLKEETLARDLKLEERARADGVRNFPPADATDLCQLEIEVVTRGQHAIDEIAQWLKTRLVEQGKAIRELAPTADERDIEARIDNARGALAALREQNRDDLPTLAADELEARRLLNKFKRDNKLTRKAYYVDSTIWLAAIGFVTLLGEAAFNARIFAPVSDGGAAAWATAFAFGVVNFIIAAGAIGWLSLRHVGHVSQARRALGALGVGLGLTLLLGYNAWLGHLRAAIAEDQGRNNVAPAFSNLIKDPLGFLDTPDAMQLFLVGLGFALIFILKGYNALDRYPGYRGADMAYRKSIEAYAEARKRFRKDANALIEKEIISLGRNLDGADRRNRKALALINQAELDYVAAENGAIDSAAACQRLVSRIRTENAAIRTDPAPAYFPVLPELDAELRGLPAVDFGRYRDERLADLADLRERAKAGQSRLRDIKEEALGMIADEAEHAAQRGEMIFADRAKDDPFSDDTIDVNEGRTTFSMTRAAE